MAALSGRRCLQPHSRIPPIFLQPSQTWTATAVSTSTCSISHHMGSTQLTGAFATPVWPERGDWLQFPGSHGSESLGVRIGKVVRGEGDTSSELQILRVDGALYTDAGKAFPLGSKLVRDSTNTGICECVSEQVWSQQLTQGSRDLIFCVVMAEGGAGRKLQSLSTC